MQANIIEEPPGRSKPPHPWSNVSPEDWNDWRWQLRHRLISAEDLAEVIDLSKDEVIALTEPGHFRVGITPYFASLMDPKDPTCPIRRQVIPTAAELKHSEAEMIDSLAEDSHSPVPGIVHRYPDRALLLATTHCASYCRFCTRNRMVGAEQGHAGSGDLNAQLAYIRATPEIRDVLVSGGDVLTMPTAKLRHILFHLRAIPHVEVIRIGTRAPVFLPQRITPKLVEMLRCYHPLWMNIHINHPKEITPESSRALSMLADAGIPLGSQTVLLAGINDCPNTMTALVHKLTRNRVRPYYIYQCDQVSGAGHFRTPVAKGIEIMEALRGHTSGLAVPTFVIDAPGGGGKVPIGPNYLLSMSDSKVVVRNYEGLITSYSQPTEYRTHDPASCRFCQEAHSQGVQEGVYGLLEGKGVSIVPERWSTEHARGSAVTPMAMPALMALPEPAWHSEDSI